MKKLIAICAVVCAAALHSMACTNLIVTKGASKNGSAIVSYAADSHTLYGELYHYPAAKHEKGAMRKIENWDSGKPLGYISEAERTYNVVGNMNEHALAIGETTFGGHDELVDTTGIMDYGSLMYVALQRTKNAREAIKVMTDLVAQYGYHSSGESFSIVDTSEAWILEMVGKGSKTIKDAKGKPFAKGAVWVAVRIPDGYVSAHANQARIRQFPLATGKNSSISSKDMKRLLDKNVDVIYSADVVDFARAAGYYKGMDKDFSFSDAYNPVDFGGARFCDARVWAFFNAVNNEMDAYLDYAMGHNLTNRIPLYIKPNRQLSALDIAGFMRNHYEGTPMDMTKDFGAGAFACPYRWRPMTWKLDSVDYLHERAIATQQTGFWFVAEARAGLPSPIAGVLWFGVDDAATSCLTPIYGSSTVVPECFRVGNGDMLTYSPTAAFWTFNRVTNFAYLRYNAISADIIKVQQDQEQQAQKDLFNADEVILNLYKSEPSKVQDYINNFSVKTAEQMHARWQDLDKYLLVKFIDGNIKKEDASGFTRTPYGNAPSPIQPELPEKYRRAIVQDNGEVLRVR
ncbi:MAG: C69 family dipeptidase [Prevotellaceae bacterium]|jgi:dipeptidase|nr:C69 family dipeptidase [Prevotellaceae bacterium]